MDAQMDSTSVSLPNYPTWDFKVVGGIVPAVSGQVESDQRAELAVFVQKGLIPQLPEIGIDWTGFLLRDLSFGDLDYQIKENLANTGDTTHAPIYSAVEDSMIVTVQRSN